MGELRYVAAAAVTLIGSATIIGFTPVNPGLSDVAVRGIDLAASTAGQADPEIAEFENRIREALDGDAGGARDDLGYGEIQSDEPDSTVIDLNDVDPTLTEQDALDSLTSQNLLDELNGGGLDASPFTQGAPELADVATGVGDPGLVVPGVGGVGDSGAASATGAANAANAAYSAASVAFADIWPALQSSYESLTAAIAAAELELNGQLVDAQEAAAAQLFGDDSFASDVAMAIFSAGNRSIIEHEAALNQLLGVNLSSDDLHSSLTVGFDPETLSHTAAAGVVSPEDLSDILNALQSADLGNLISNVNWDDVFTDIFNALF